MPLNYDKSYWCQALNKTYMYDMSICSSSVTHKNIWTLHWDIPVLVVWHTQGNWVICSNSMRLITNILPKLKQPWKWKRQKLTIEVCWVRWGAFSIGWVEFNWIVGLIQLSWVHLIFDWVGVRLLIFLYINGGKPTQPCSAKLNQTTWSR